MEGIYTALLLLHHVSTVFICCFLQNAFGDHFFITESATCLRATVNCMMDYQGQLAYEPHLDQYEQDTGCSTKHLAIWLWNRKPYSCKFQNGTGYTDSVNRASKSNENSTSTSSSPTISTRESEETHRYICVTNGEMGKQTDLCSPKAIENTIEMEQSKSYVEAVIGPSVGAVVILAVLVLVILYKRRTRERPTPYWPHELNKSSDGTKILYDTLDVPVTQDKTDPHYTLPKTTCCADMTYSVRPALRKPTDVRAWASEADLYALPYQPHRGLCFKSSVGSKSGAVSSPDIHIYDTIESCCNQRKYTHKYINCTPFREKLCTEDGDHGYIEFFSTSGAASAPDLHLSEELKPCCCVSRLGKTCSCVKYTSLRRPQNNFSQDVHDGIDFHVISGSISAPDLT